MNVSLNKKLHASTLIELLCKRAKNQPDKLAYTFLKEGEDGEISLTYRQLDDWTLDKLVQTNGNIQTALSCSCSYS